MLFFIRTIWAVCAFHHEGAVYEYKTRPTKPRTLSVDVESFAVLQKNPQIARHRRELTSHRSLCERTEALSWSQEYAFHLKRSLDQGV